MNDRRHLQLRQRQLAGLLLLALLAVTVAVLRARHGDLLPPGWWRW